MQRPPDSKQLLEPLLPKENDTAAAVSSPAEKAADDGYKAARDQLIMRATVFIKQTSVAVIQEIETLHYAKIDPVRMALETLKNPSMFTNYYELPARTKDLVDKLKTNQVTIHLLLQLVDEKVALVNQLNKFVCTSDADKQVMTQLAQSVTDQMHLLVTRFDGMKKACSVLPDMLFKTGHAYSSKNPGIAQEIIALSADLEKLYKASFPPPAQYPAPPAAPPG